MYPHVGPIVYSGLLLRLCEEKYLSLFIEVIIDGHQW